MDSQQLKDSKRKCLLQNACINDDDAGTNMSSYEVKFTCCPFFNDPALSDVKLDINNGQLEFYAHRVILSSRSEYFRTMFTEKSHSQSKTVHLTAEEEFEPVFESFLKFLYGVPVDICKENMWLYYFMAEEYMVDDLTKACGAYAREGLTITKRKRPESVALDPIAWFTPQEVVDIHEFFNVEVVKGYAAANLMARFDSVPEEVLFSMSRSCLCAVLNTETSVLSERDLFQRAIGWLEHEEKRVTFAEDVLSTIRYCHFTKPSDIMDAQTNRYVGSSPSLVSLVAAGCHYKFMKKEFSPEDFAKLQEFKKRQYANRRYRKADGSSSRIPGTPDMGSKFAAPDRIPGTPDVGSKTATPDTKLGTPPSSHS